eukprot:CAMPEP_0197023296 /NCGR_PEP_ID=MMETSP1384-20130603/4029_1 /TAXON_ID=29189 /ORGANISM="Ammonia sp." /LENGTH=212 /DNA_ID=CAMNT_0042451491 /DNA_START=60 /DNA_END=698 /DNA_ORIENTATION=-
MNKLIVLLSAIGYAQSQMVVTPPAWPTYWAGFYTLVNTTYASDLHSAGSWYADFRSYPKEDGLLRQDMTYGCNGGGFSGSCRGIFKDNNFYQYSIADNLCCLAFANLAPTPPDWLVNISTATGSAQYDWTGEPSSTWQFMTTHTYYAALDTGLPVAERGGGTDLIWYSLTSQVYNSDVYALSSNCSEACPSNQGKDLFRYILKNHLNFKGVE